jgi:Leucine-rich repeat (LRR) protein
MDTKAYRIAVKRLANPSSTGSVNLEALKLTVLPPIPETVCELYCGYNQLTALPELHSNLRKLSCPHNLITVLPRLDHTQLTILQCYKNQLTELPTLPVTVTELLCSDNKLTSLPPIQHTQITRLICNDNPLTQLPELPRTLESLYCVENQLQTFPQIAHTQLKDLITGHNQLTEIPALPSTIESIYCFESPIRRLPELPMSFRFLKIDPLHFIPPFDTYYEIFQQTGNIAQLRNSIHRYYTFRKGQNISALKQTLGRQGPLSENMATFVGRFLSGKSGTLNMQRTALQRNAGIGGTRRHKNRKSRKTRKSITYDHLTNY